MKAKNLVSLTAIILFVYSAAYGSENFLENRIPLLQNTTGQQSALLSFSLLENPVVPLLQNTTVFTRQGTENRRDVPFEQVVFNSCCDENVRITGSAHIVVNRNAIHISISDITGTGLETGHTYIGRGTANQSMVFYSEQFEGSFNFRLNMTNENGCGFTLKLLFNLSVNNNGEITSSVENVNVFCRP